MTIESAASLAAFSAFSVVGYLSGTATEMLLDKGVDVEDAEGNFRRVDYVIHMRASTSWARGDIATVNGTAYKLGDRAADDGYIVKVTAVKYQ